MFESQRIIQKNRPSCTEDENKNIVHQNAPYTMGSNYNLENLKPLIRSMVMSHRNKTVCVQELQRDFEAIEGFPIPYAKLGFANVVALLHAMPDIVQLSVKNGISVVTYVSSPATEHVEQLIQRSCYRKRGKRGRNIQTANPPRAGYHFRSKVTRNQGFGLNFHTTMEVHAPKIPNAAKQTYAMVTKEENVKQGVENFHLPLQQPTFLQQPTAIMEVSQEDSNASWCETCEHVDGNVLSWKPYCDIWDSVSMIDLPPNVMHLSHTIPKADVSHYFSEKAVTNVRILHVLNPNRIWLRSVLQDKTVEQLHVQMQECYYSLPRDEWCLEKSKVQHGLYCAVQIDQVWHRVKIVGPLIASHVKIFFIDTGLVEFVDYTRLYFLFNAFRTIPAQAIRASLAYLFPKDSAWTRAESECLSAMITSDQKVLAAYTLNVNHKIRVLDIDLRDGNVPNSSINEHFAKTTEARWTGAIYVSKGPDAYRCKRRSFNEKHPSFYCIEEGHFPTVDELRNFVARNFDYEELYSRLPHFEKNGVVEKISQAINDKMVQLHGIVSATNQEEIKRTLLARET